MTGFKPVKIPDNKSASQYLDANKAPLGPSERGAVDRYTGDGFLDINRSLRAGDRSDPDVARLDAAMRPAPHDLVVTRTVDTKSFGDVSPADLEKTKVNDAAFASTSIGTPYSQFSGVTMHIAVPKGTPLILAAPHSRNVGEREILLDRGLPMAVTRVVPNDLGGFDMYLVVLPKEGGS